MSCVENTRKPEGMGGKVMVSRMNLGHRALSDWGFQFLPDAVETAVLDCGCGGGANIEKLLKKYPNSIVKGIDYAPISVEKARKVNRQAILTGRCVILQGSVADMLFAAGWFDLVTAFETVYFWPDLPRSFLEVCRVLKPGGTFFICNECSDDTGKDAKWPELIEGMTIYRDTQLKAALEQAGFRDIQTHRNQKGWLCVTARK